MQLRARVRGTPLALLCLAALAAGVGCGDNQPVPFADAAAMDAPDDIADARVTRPPDAETRDAQGRVCTRSSQCDDGIDCTMDFCSADGRCVSTPNHMACDDRVYCNGLEQCDARRGCVRGTPVACNDNYTCTVDRCDEETKRCQHVPRDFDRDGDPDGRCRAAECDGGMPVADASIVDGSVVGCWIGGDCDDQNPRVSSRLPELCGDMVDNNCNGMVDSAEPGGCMRPPHDTCDDPLDVSRGGSFTIPLAGTTGHYRFTCAGMLQRDVVARLRLTQPRDVTFTTTANSGLVYLQLVRGTCQSPAMAADSLACTLGSPTVVRKRALPAGDYFVMLGTSSGTTAATDISLQVDLAPATTPPSNDLCTSPVVIPPTGGTFRGDLVDVAANVNTRCGGTRPDLVYSITLPARANVVARATSTRNDSLTLALVDRCVASPNTLRCDTNAPAAFTARELEPGTYFLVVGGNTINPFTLEVMVTPPSPPPMGDTCRAPFTLTPGMTLNGSFNDMEADYQFSCSGTGSRDTVYRFTLAERRDVNVTVRGSASDYFYVALNTTCDNRATERACRFGSPGRLSVRGLDPGTYFVLVKGLRGGDYSISLDATPPVTPVSVVGNDTCAQAFAIPAGGGVFNGATTMARHDFTPPCSTGSTAEDVVFRYRVERRSRVNLSTEGSSFDTLLWVTTGAMCPGTNVPGGCNDDSIGTAAALELTLDPGDYWIHVGGFGAARGNYTLTVTSTAL